MHWIARLHSAIDHIETHLCEEADLPALARIMHCSTHDLQRVFSYLVEMPIGEYMQKRRLTLAGAAVQQGEEKIIDIGLAYGYTSHSAFSRSFKAFHGVTPSQARLDPDFPLEEEELGADTPVSFKWVL